MRGLGGFAAGILGPLICHREGLIDDGNPQYPALERITHYAAVTGAIEDFRIRPAFQAFSIFASLIPGCRYEGRLNIGPMLEVHAFASAGRRIHAVWTINGRAAALADLYGIDDLNAAEYLTRDGLALDALCAVVSESPIYLSWSASRPVSLKSTADVLKDVAIHRHISGKTHFFFREKGWQGLVLAKDAAEAARLLQKIDPNRLAAPTSDTILRKARNAIWTIDDPRIEGARLVVKQPVKMHLHKKLLDRFKPSKGLRSWNGTAELLRRGIDAAPPVAYFEKTGDTSLTQNYYLCEYVSADFSARELLSAFACGEHSHQGVSESEAYRQLCDYLLAMHGRGILFRDLSGGNILIRKQAGGKLAFSLIDTGRIHAFNRPLPIGKRLADLVRICNKLHWEGRELLMAAYMVGLGRQFGWWHRLSFHAYDFKVALKRRVGRKTFVKLFAGRWN